jgi:hypothetical protein
MINHLSLSLS